ncbi:hypothetical protein QTP70_029943 [Hemibagrus guttatus]|uniref:Death-associated protein 1 n=1 Tax=Hemibagrus guttatus TaxID=175788 RepID=A0AAE0Q8U3_9TELE|nr:hypothetical protein QTP70_029943 [Hemibagrus guttatus]
MSSPPKEKHETRAGHPPAVKAGGMRIVQKHQSAGDSTSDRKEDKDSKEFESCRVGYGGKAEGLFSTSVSKRIREGDYGPPKLPVVVSGVVTKGDKDFTPAAAQVAHTKPQPSVQKLPSSHHINQHIHQPRK